ncbi:MAG: beta-lactamase family protein [Acidimicrobiales bacterium]|nr:beta-lactamase family protein [Acidimicrobiales bacterium]MCB9395984.1 beta-lactamase family protein [Acidimicrobiaceae bacterium]
MRAADRLQVFVDTIVSGDGPEQGCIAAVSGADGATVRACSGIARADDAFPLTVDTPFHVASVGKMLTATLVHQLVDDGLVGPRGLDATLPELAELGLVDPVLAAGVHPQADSITLRHLLSHTSGMKDMQVDDADGTAEQHGGPAPGSIQASYGASVVRASRGTGDGAFARRRWTAWDPSAPDDPEAGHLNLFLASGTAAAPAGAPGERFHYSDTAFALLGTIVEAARGTSYADAQRTRILDPLGMSHTYLAYGDDPAPDARAREMDVWLAGVGLLSGGFDLSFDWGGGGQVSTVDDLLRLVRGVLAGTCVSAASRDAMLTPSPCPGLPLPRIGMGLGVHHHRVGERHVIGHAGAWGVRAFVEPASGLAVAATVGCLDPCAWLGDLFDLAEAIVREESP